MRAVFLRGREVDLCPVEPGDGVLLDLMPWRLPPGDARGESIGMTAVGRDGAPVGLVRVDAIDWVGREARLVLRWRQGRPGAEEALALARQYAREELDLQLFMP